MKSPHDACRLVMVRGGKVKKILGSGLVAAAMIAAAGAAAQTVNIDDAMQTAQNAPTAPPPGPPPASMSPFDATAPVGKAAGTVMVRVRVIGVIPGNWSSTISAIGGHVTTTNQVAPEIDVSYFFTDNIAAELIAASTRHQIQAVDTALGDVDVGSTWVLPPTLTLQYHFAPHERFSPYIGAGLNATFFYAENGAKPIVQSLSLSNNIGGAVQVGFDYNFTGHWFLNLDFKQLIVHTTASLNHGAIKAQDWLSPAVLGGGIGYRF